MDNIKKKKKLIWIIYIYRWIISKYLVGGLEHVVFHILGIIIIPTDEHMFQDGYCTTNQEVQPKKRGSN